MEQLTQKTPKWSKHFTNKEWKHIQDGQATRFPSLRGLKQDAETCPECRMFLRRLGGAR